MSKSPPITLELPDHLVGPLLEFLVDRLASNERFIERVAAQVALPQDRWLETREAASCLGVSMDTLHKLTAARAIPFSQERPGAKCYFRHSDLDRYREMNLHKRR